MLDSKVVFISLTTRCNIRCAKCWRFDVFGSGRDVKDDVLEKIMEIFAYYKGKIIVGSGENLISKSLKKYIDWCVTYNIKTTILTNGLNFDKYIDDKNFFNPNITWGLTMDGFYNKEIENLQIGMNIEKVKNNIKIIKEKYPNSSFYLNITHMKNNLHSTEKLIKFAKEMNIKNVYITQLKLFEGLDDSLTKYQVNDFESDEFKSVMKKVKILAKKLGINLYASIDNPKPTCFQNVEKISPIIHGNGNIVFCYGRDGDILGNILDENGDKVWRNHLNKLLNSTIEREKWCSNCNSVLKSERGYYYIPTKQKKR